MRADGWCSAIPAQRTRPMKQSEGNRTERGINVRERKRERENRTNNRQIKSEGEERETERKLERGVERERERERERESPWGLSDFRSS